MTFYLLQISDDQVILYYILGAVLILVIFYLIIEAAVMNRMIGAYSQMKNPSTETSARLAAAASKLEKAPSNAHERLQTQYNKLEISFD